MKSKNLTARGDTMAMRTLPRPLHESPCPGKKGLCEQAHDPDVSELCWRCELEKHNPEIVDGDDWGR